MKREGENKERGKEGWGGRREGGRRKRGTNNVPSKLKWSYSPLC